MAAVQIKNPSFTTNQLRGIERSWREYRTYSPRQALAGDFLTNQGIFASNPKKTPYVLYGGAMWGGKSHWLRSMSFEICMVLRDLGFPNQWVGIYCDTYPNLQSRHIVKFLDEFQGIGTVQDSATRGLHVKWHGEGMGGVYLKNIVSASNQAKGTGSGRGAEVVAALTDEITELTRDQWAAVMYQCRTGIANFPFLARGHGTNPDGIGHGWVKELFVPEFRNLEDPYFKKVGVDNFFYVPALPTDNPAYETMGDVALGNLAALDDEDIRRAREFGDWDIYGSGRFSSFKKEIHTFLWREFFEKFGIPEDIGPREFLENAKTFGFELYTSLDYGTSNDSVSAYMLHAVDPDGRPWSISELHPNPKEPTGMVGMELEEQVQHIHRFEKGLRITARYADPAIGGRDKKTDQKTRLERFQDEGLDFLLAVNDRVEGAASVASLLYVKRDEFGHILSEPKWRLLRERTDGYGCPETIKQIPILPRDKNNPEDVDKRDGQNHWYDANRYFLHTRFQGGFVLDEMAAYSAAYWRQIATNSQRPQTDSRWWKRNF